MSTPSTLDTQPSSVTTHVRWSFSRRFRFRAIVLYLFLYCLPFPVDLLPGASSLADSYWLLWRPLLSAVGDAVGHPVTMLPNGSGDTTFNYLLLLCMIVAALLGALTWSVIDRRRTSCVELQSLLHTYLRCYLATAMLSYGVAKVALQQFPSLSHDRLMQTYGDSSPMGLLWTFIGYSAPYQIFGGAVEMLGGFLLLARRTTPLGAIVIVIVMTNVVLLNFCYDVPVKLYSSHLLLIASYLFVPHAARTLLALTGHAVPPRHEPFILRRAAHRRLAPVIKAAFLLVLTWSLSRDTLADGSLHNDLTDSPLPLGAFEVESCIRDGQPVPPLLTDSAQWRRVAFNEYGVLSIRCMDNSLLRYRIVEARPVGRLTLAPFSDQSARQTMTWSRIDDDHIDLRTIGLSANTAATLRRIPGSAFPLQKRGFHWVNEFPVNQ